MSGRDAKAGARIAESVLELIGSTPLVRLRRIVPAGAADVLAKLESYNPGGSVKDRAALEMIRAAEREGRLDAQTVIVEPTSGNTGIGLAVTCAALGYRIVLVMPDEMSLERLSLLRRLGAEVVLTPAKQRMEGAVHKARQIADSLPKAFVPSQFDNAANPEAHSKTTAEEILAATDGRIDAVVAGVGTGGTLMGIARVLRIRSPRTRVVAVEPALSAVLSGGSAANHRIQGIGPGFVPPLFDRSLVSEVRAVTDRDAFERMKELASREGILAGISSGAALHVALAVASELGAGARLVVIMPDTGERYLSLETYFDL